MKGNRLERQKSHTSKAKGYIILVPISTTMYKNHSIVLKETVTGSQSMGNGTVEASLPRFLSHSEEIKAGQPTSQKRERNM